MHRFRNAGIIWLDEIECIDIFFFFCVFKDKLHTLFELSFSVQVTRGRRRRWLTSNSHEKTAPKKIENRSKLANSCLKLSFNRS